MTTFSNIKIRKIPGIQRTSPIERDRILSLSMFIWQNMGLTNEQLAFGAATMGLESTFNITALAQAPSHAYGLGQFQPGTWVEAVNYYNSNYGNTFGNLSSANENDLVTYIAVMGAWINKVWAKAVAYSSDPSLNGFSTAEIAYGLWHHGQNSTITQLSAYLNDVDPTKGFNYPGLRGYFDTTLSQAVQDIANLQQTVGTGLSAPGHTDPDLAYSEIDTTALKGRFYANGVFYTQDTQTGQEFWSIPTDSGGELDVTQFGNGVIVTQNFTVNGQLVTSIPGTLALADSASDDIKAAFQKWKDAGNDPANINPADIRIDDSIAGTNWYTVRPDTFNWQYTENANTLTFTTLVAGEADPADSGNDIEWRIRA